MNTEQLAVTEFSRVSCPTRHIIEHFGDDLPFLHLWGDISPHASAEALSHTGRCIALIFPANLLTGAKHSINHLTDNNKTTPSYNPQQDKNLNKRARKLTTYAHTKPN